MMDAVKRLWRRLLLYRRLDRYGRELDEEMRFHLEMKVDELVEDGLSPEDARYAALKSFGGLLETKDRCRDARGLPFAETLWQDVRFAARGFRHNPAFSLLAVATLALGVGANTAIFSVTNAVLLRPLPYAEPERLVVLSSSMPESRQAGFSMADFVDFKEQSRSFERLGGFYYETVNLGTGGSTDSRPAGYVSADFFAALGAQPTLGRAFRAEDDRPGAPQVVVVSHEVWQQRLGGVPDAVGRTVALDGRPFEVIGVMPAGFQLYEKTDLWLPMGLWPYSRARDNHWALFAVGRLEPGATLEAAQMEMDGIAAELRRQYPGSNADRGATLVALQEDMVGEVRPSLRLLVVAVGFVLLIACANVANLLLARGAARQRELAVRAALGAGRARIVRQLLTESLLLALAGGALGVLLAYWVADLVTSVGGASIPRLDELGTRRVDLDVLAFSLAASVLAGLVFGLAPAWRAASPALSDVLKEGGRGGSPSRSRLRDALVVGEVALALVLLVGAGLLVKSILLLRGASPGYEPNQVLAVGVSFPRGSYRTDADKSRFAEQALERVRAVPGVELASFSYPLPVYGMAWGMFFTVEGEPPPEPGRGAEGRMASVSPGFFATLRIPVLEGRDFAESDGRAALHVVIVDETLARRHWPGESPIGKRLTVGGDTPRTVVGVVGAVKNMGLAEVPRPQIYIPYLQPLESASFVPFGYLSARTAVEPASVAAAVRSALGEVDGGVAVFKSQTMDELLDRSVSQRRFFVQLMQLFAGLSLALAAVGVYGVMAYSVTRRTREIGVRIALGARRSDVLRLVVGEGARLALVGIAVGLLAAFALSRLMRNLLFGVSATDPAVYAVVAVLLMGVALAACWLPAFRATRVDPLTALRSE